MSETSNRISLGPLLPIALLIAFVFALFSDCSGQALPDTTINGKFVSARTIIPSFGMFTKVEYYYDYQGNLDSFTAYWDVDSVNDHVLDQYFPDAELIRMGENFATYKDVQTGGFVTIYRDLKHMSYYPK